MDYQRSEKIGKANYWIVVPITNPDLLGELKEVQNFVTNKYKSCIGELKKTLLNLNEKSHISLLGLHANKGDFEKIRSTLADYSILPKYHTKVRVQNLGSWFTKGKNIVLYADFDKTSVKLLQQLARDLSQWLHKRMETMEFSGNVWVDKPGDIYQPHITLLQSQSLKLAKVFLDTRNIDQIEIEQFGWSRHLFRKTKKYFKCCFGEQKISVKLQNNFTTLLNIKPPSHQRSKNN